MVGTPILLGQNHGASSVADTGISDDVVVTLSRALAADELGLVGVLVMQHTGAPATPAVTGGGITWQLVDANPFRALGNQATLFVFAGKSASPSGTSVTVSAGAPYRIAIAQVLGVASGSTSFVQVVPGSGAAASAVDAQLATMTDTINNAFVAFGTYTRGAPTARTWVVDTAGGYTLLDSRAATDGNNVTAALASQYNVGVDTVDPLVGFGLSGGVDYLGVTVLEVAEDGGGGTTTTLEADPFTAGASFTDATFERVTQADPTAVTASFADVTFSIDLGGFTLDADPMAIMASFSDVTFSIDPGGFTLDADPMSVSASFADAALNYVAHTLTADPLAVAALFADAALRQVVTKSAQATRASVSISIGL